MKRNPIQTYALTVCFASLLAGTISLTVAVYDIVQITFPEFTSLSHRTQLGVLRNQQIITSKQQSSDPVQGEESSSANTSAAVITTPMIDSFGTDIHVNQAIQSLIVSSIVLFLCAGIFFFHWRLAKRTYHDDA